MPYRIITFPSMSQGNRLFTWFYVVSKTETVQTICDTPGGEDIPETKILLAHIWLTTNIKSLAEEENLPVKIMMLDVTDDRSVNNTIQSITNETSRIDVLVNNAGYGLMGAFEVTRAAGLVHSVR
jgi:NAD(P)-dependent dehydrogenase (short-subunit alcohol dehydrogenase family)